MSSETFDFHILYFSDIYFIFSLLKANPSDAAYPSAVSTKYAPYGKSVVIECNTDLSLPVEYSWAKFGPQMEPIYDRVRYYTSKLIQLLKRYCRFIFKKIYIFFLEKLNAVQCYWKKRRTILVHSIERNGENGHSNCSSRHWNHTFFPWLRQLSGFSHTSQHLSGIKHWSSL